MIISTHEHWIDGKIPWKMIDFWGDFWHKIAIFLPKSVVSMNLLFNEQFYLISWFIRCSADQFHYFSVLNVQSICVFSPLLLPLKSRNVCFYSTSCIYSKCENKANIDKFSYKTHKIIVSFQWYSKIFTLLPSALSSSGSVSVFYLCVCLYCLFPPSKFIHATFVTSSTSYSLKTCGQNWFF